MKNAYVLAILFLAAAPAHAGDKICMVTRDGTMTNTPCVMGKKTGQMEFDAMLFKNTEGYQSLVSPRNQSRLEMIGLHEGTVRITALEDGKDSHGLYKTVIRFEVAMDDCGSTDACGNKFVWTVIETRTADGFCTDAEFKNSLTEVTKYPSWVKAE